MCAQQRWGCMTGHDTQYPLEQLLRLSEASTWISLQWKKSVLPVSDLWECLHQGEMVAFPAEVCVPRGAVLPSQAAAEWGQYTGSSLWHCRCRNLDLQLCWGRGRQNCCVRKRRWLVAGDFCEEKEDVCFSCWTMAAEKVHCSCSDEGWWHCVTKKPQTSELMCKQPWSTRRSRWG